MNEMTPNEISRHWTDRDTLTVQETADVLRLGRSAAYVAVKRKEIPSINIGGRILIPVPALKHLLGYSAASA